MSDHLHILITGEEGKGRNFVLSKYKLKGGVLCMAGLLLTFSLTSYNSFHSIKENTHLSSQTDALHDKITSLTEQLSENKTANASLTLRINSLEERNSIQAETFQLEKQNLLDTAVSELEERSDMIERIMCNIGVDIKDTRKADTSNSGGPFLEPRENIGKELLFRSDTFLNTINVVPLGRPVPGQVSSRFGHRSDRSGVSGRGKGLV